MPSRGGARSLAPLPLGCPVYREACPRRPARLAHPPPGLLPTQQGQSVPRRKIPRVQTFAADGPPSQILRAAGTRAASQARCSAPGESRTRAGRRAAPRCVYHLSQSHCESTQARRRRQPRPASIPFDTAPHPEPRDSEAPARSCPGAPRVRRQREPASRAPLAQLSRQRLLHQPSNAPRPQSAAGLFRLPALACLSLRIHLAPAPASRLHRRPQVASSQETAESVPERQWPGSSAHRQTPRKSRLQSRLGSILPDPAARPAPCRELPALPVPRSRKLGAPSKRWRRTLPGVPVPAPWHRQPSLARRLRARSDLPAAGCHQGHKPRTPVQQPQQQPQSPQGLRRSPAPSSASSRGLYRHAFFAQQLAGRLMRNSPHRSAALQTNAHPAHGRARLPAHRPATRRAGSKHGSGDRRPLRYPEGLPVDPDTNLSHGPRPPSRPPSRPPRRPTAPAKRALHRSPTCDQAIHPPAAAPRLEHW